jgi:hypothetical protein
MIEALGAKAEKLAFKEVYGALKSGAVDGQENSWSNIYTKQFFDRAGWCDGDQPPVFWPICWSPPTRG